MKKRATKLMSFLMASAMAVTSPYAAGVSAAAVYAAGTGETEVADFGAGGGKITTGSALQTSVTTGTGTMPYAADGVSALSDESGKSEILLENYTFDSTSTWDEKSWKDLSLTTEAVPAKGTTLAADILLPGSQPAFSGTLKVRAAIKVGDGWKFVQSNAIADLSAADFQDTVNIDGTDYYKNTVRISFGETVGTSGTDGSWDGSASFETAVTGAVKGAQLQFAGYQCDYSGQIGILNAKLENTAGSGTDTPGDNTGAAGGKEWNFDSDTGNWEYAQGWNYQYDGNDPAVSWEDGKMKITVDFSKNGGTDWSQTGVREWGEVSLKGTTQTTFDFYYDPAKLDGDFKFKQTFQYEDGSKETAAVDTAMDKSSAVDAQNGLKKVQVTMNFDEVAQETCCNVVLLIVGSNTSYSGDVYIDNLKISKGAPVDDGMIDVILTGSDTTGSVSAQNGQLTVYQKDGAPVQVPLADTAYLVDKDADAATKGLYAYLKAMGESDSVIYGHQNDTWHHAGSLSESDTKDVTGSISGVIGIDALSLTGAEYTASRYNSEIADQTIPETIAGNVKAAAALTNHNIAQGAIISLSEHMPNFSVVAEREGYDPNTEPSYAKYDFSGYTPGTLTGDCMNEILPGGKYNEKYNAYLDMIADYLSQVNGPVLFRPFHENTGSWFWWGAAFCQPATYRNVWKYTVDYLRDTKSVHNLLYVYGPGSEAATLEEYGERYPGDDYVDMVGFDMYNSEPGADNETAWFAEFKKELKLVDDFATAHGKLIAVTETGVANGDKALLKKDNPHKDWYLVMLDAVSASHASYFLLWANFGADGSFYTPYVKKETNTAGGRKLHGHEMLQNFYDFFCDGRSIFAANQKDVITNIGSVINVTAKPTTESATGYIIAPVSGKRMLEASTVKAKVNHLPDGGSVSFILHGKGKDVTVTAVKADVYYEAAVTSEILASLGEYVGTMDLCADGKVLDTVEVLFNVQPPKEDPYEIDGFENYLGVDSMLNSAWATNKATGNTITLSLNTDKDKIFDGEYSMKFAYDETSNGWAGATISKEVDWSDCDALQFYTIPDGKNQKVVIQLTANNKIYEAYLNLYEEYAGKTTPLLVTIPFADFCDRDAQGSPKGGLVNDRGSITSFGLWVNAIADSPAIVDGRVSGVIYYDKITAVKSGLTKATFQNPDEIVKDPVTDTTPGGDSSSGGGYPWYGYAPGSGTNTGSSTNTGTDTPPQNNTTPSVPDGNTQNRPQQPVNTEKKVEVGDQVQTDNAEYEVTAAENGVREVAYTGISKKEQTVYIPSSIYINGIVYKVTAIADKAFDADKKLRGVIIPSTVRKIGNYAFRNCTKLTAVTIPKNVKTIGKNAFSGCTSMKSVALKGNKLTTIGQGAFQNNKNLTKIILPASVKIIRKNAFNGCRKLKTVQIQSAKMNLIGRNALKGTAKNIVVKVPAGRKGYYVRLLKKSGYTGKVKQKDKK